MLRKYIIVALLSLSSSSCIASTFEFEGIYQQTQAGAYDGLYRTVVTVWIQNGSPGPPDYGWGVGTVAEAVVDLDSLLGDVIEIIVERNPLYSNEDEVWNQIYAYISSYKREVYQGWIIEIDTYESEFAEYSYGEPSEFDHYLVFRNMGGPSDVWNNYNVDPDNDALIFGIELRDLLDFDQDARVDPDEILIWDGGTGGSYPNDYKPSVASPVTVAKGSGFYLHAGIDRQGGPIPVLSIKDRFTLGEVVQLASDTPSTLNFTAERADPYGYYRWIYIVQHSNDLETWANQAHYSGDGQAVAHSITADGKGFWRILIANEKDFKPFNLAPSSTVVSAPSQVFTWEGAEAAESYTLLLSTDSSFDNTETFTSATEQTKLVPTLNAGQTYYWKVVANFADELQIESTTATFNTSVQ